MTTPEKPSGARRLGVNGDRSTPVDRRCQALTTVVRRSSHLARRHRAATVPHVVVGARERLPPVNRSPFFLAGLCIGLALATWAHAPLIKPLAMGCTGTNLHSCGALQ